jgi:hypothetical protein
MWLMTGASGRLLWTWLWTFCLHKRRGMWLGEQLLASQVGLLCQLDSGPLAPLGGPLTWQSRGTGCMRMWTINRNGLTLHNVRLDATALMQTSHTGHVRLTGWTNHTHTARVAQKLKQIHLDLSVRRLWLVRHYNASLGLLTQTTEQFSF